jgi:hypothetical protein
VNASERRKQVEIKMNANSSNAAQWLDLYRLAATETDIEKLPWKVGIAVEAIDERVRYLSDGFNGSVEEKVKIDQALIHLLALLKKNAA